MKNLPFFFFFFAKRSICRGDTLSHGCSHCSPSAAQCFAHERKTHMEIKLSPLIFFSNYSQCTFSFFFPTIKLKYSPFSWQRNRGSTLTLYPQASSWPYFSLLMSCHCVIFTLQPQCSGQPHSCPRTCPKQGSKSQVIKLCCLHNAAKNSTLDQQPNVSNHLRFCRPPLSCFLWIAPWAFHILCCARCVVVSGYFPMHVEPTFFYGGHK